MEPKRLNKYISDTGFCSRRDADQLIEQGRVTVNGKIPTDPGMKVTPKDKVRIDDETLVVKEEKPVYLIFNKPANMSATSDSSVRDNVVRAINFPASLEPTAMLEREAEGIIFLSNDGDFVRHVKRSDNKYEKEYVVTVDKLITADFLQKISGGGAPIPGEERKNNSVSKEAQTRFRITLKPGTDHYLKRMCESLGYKVVHLQRVGFGDFSLAKLPTGHWRVLTPQEVNSLLQPGMAASERRSSGSIYSKPDKTARTERTGARSGADRSKDAKSRSTSPRGPRKSDDRPPSNASSRSAKSSDDRKTGASTRGAKSAATDRKSTAPKSGAGSPARSTRDGSFKGGSKSGTGRGAAPKGASGRRSDTLKGGPKKGR
ncbi:pseudouridine synthase [Pontibacter roseus]|uniref:pseudouridine synthase n=1 Tax=Pontibacter roseus TaxID=336989 RepID=UPI000381414F|nr:S4 domain-containing protein [Pontibacter roseus]